MHVCISAKTLILILSLCLGSLLVQVPNVEAASAAQGSLFNMLPIYLKSTASSIPGYYTVSVTPPSGSTIHSITLTSSGMFSQWISNAYVFPGGSITIDRFYCFLFSMYANSTAFEAGRMFGQFCIYRGGSEIFLFNTTESEYIRNSTASRHIWYYRTQQNITFLSGDRLVFKLFLNVAAPDSFTFYYDSVSHRSYLTDPSETRYLLKSTWTQNGLTTKKLSLSFPSDTFQAVSKLAGRAVSNASWGIRVWNRTIASVETEITSGSPVALVNRTANNVGYQAQSNTWACPAANWDQSSNCSLVVQWFCTFDNNGTWYNMQNSTTEGLSSSFLNASTWTITYYTSLLSKTIPVLASAGMAYDGIEESGAFYPTRIANIVYVSADFAAPYYYNVIVNENTLASEHNHLYCNWTEVGSVKSSLSKYRYGQNNSGTFTYSIWELASFGVTTENLTATFLNNNTVGNIIAVKWECNDTSGNLNDTMPYQYYTITSSVSWQTPIVWGCWFYRNWSTAIIWSDCFYRNWSSAITWEDHFYRNWSISITWENWFFRNWSSAIYWTDDYLNLTIEIIPGWQPPIVWQFKIGINPNELAQAGVIALIFFPILLLLIVLLLRRKR